MIFTLPLPPTANHQYDPILRKAANGRLVHGKRWSDAYQAWRDEVGLIVKGWTPAPKTPLSVGIELRIPKRIGRRADVDGWIKPILDAVVGKHCDQWIDNLWVKRCASEHGTAVVTVVAMKWCVE